TQPRRCDAQARVGPTARRDASTGRGWRSSTTRIGSAGVHRRPGRWRSRWRWTGRTWRTPAGHARHRRWTRRTHAEESSPFGAREWRWHGLCFEVRALFDEAHLGFGLFVEPAELFVVVQLATRGERRRRRGWRERVHARAL